MIDALPTAPNRNMTPEAFIATADAWVAAMSTFATQVNSDLNLILNLSGLLATSTTSLLIGTGSKSLTVETSKAFLPTQSVRLYSTASPANYMLGTVTSYDAGTGALVVGVTSVGGSGTLAAWTVVLAASGEWLGNATSATSATSATTATNQSGGTVSATSVSSSGAITSSSPTAGIGYAAGAGGGVTQLTSKSTGVTLNKKCGYVVTHSEALAANAVAAFVFTNSGITSGSTIVMNAQSGAAGAYHLSTYNIAAGQCVIAIRNLTAGSLSENIRINFAIINTVDS